MKKLIAWGLIAVSAFLALFSISFSLDNTVRYNQLMASSTNQFSSIKTRLTRLEDENECFVVLLEHDGIIGIFDKDRRYLLGTINVAVKTLPENDRKKLLEGIEVKDSEKFISLFEDYSS